MTVRLKYALILSLLSALLPGAAVSESQIKLATHPAVSPTGDRIAFGYLGDVWVAGVEGGVARRLTLHTSHDDEPEFSPDGKRIAFTSNRAGSVQIFVTATDGGAPRQLTYHSEGYSLQDWSADGLNLLAIGARDHHWKRPQRLLTVSANRRSAERILFDARTSYGKFSSDGSRVLLVREGERWWRKGYVGSRAAQIWCYEIATGRFEKLLDDPGGCRSPLWKPDGSGFYYVGAETGSFNLREYDFESRKTKALTQFTDDSVVFPAISRDGKTIVFRHLFDLYRFRTDRQLRPALIELRANTDSAREQIVRRTLSEASELSVSPDGLELAFASGGDVWVMDTELREAVAVASTATEEREPLFIEKGKALLFLRDEAGQVDIYRARPKQPESFWWLNTEFEVTRLTNDAHTEINLSRCPDGKHIAFVREPGELWITDLEGKNGRLVTAGFDIPRYDFSPDGRWIAWSCADDNFNDEIWIAPVDGSRKPFNVSRHPDDDVRPRWSPDGRTLAFVGRRDGTETDIYYVFLCAEDEDQTSRDRKLKGAIEKIRKARRDAASANSASGPEPSKTANGSPDQSSKALTASKDKESTKKVTAIDFSGLAERIHRVSINGSTERGLFWFADGKTLGFQAQIDGKTGTYTIEIPGRLTPRLLSEKTGTFSRRLTNGDKVAWLQKGHPGTLSKAGQSESWEFEASQEFATSKRQQAAFDIAWRLMKDNWYDDRFNNRNWAEIRRKYTDMALAAPDQRTLTTVISLMLGELNGSHLGFRPRSTPSDNSWRPVTAHLGIRFERKHKGPGLLIRDTIEGGPADKVASRIKAGEVILRIDGTTVDPESDLTSILNGHLERDVRLTVRDRFAKEREVTLRPISYSNARRLMYPQFIKRTQSLVDELSEGAFGYLHIAAMNMSSFLEFERQLFNAGYNRDGLIIDVRENGGGFTTDHLLTALTQPQHAITVPRAGGQGYPHDRKIYATWNKPIVVLCNQNSFSNAEILSHAIKSLGRGKLVGVTTAGGVISTGSARVLDIGTLRQPFRGWFVRNTGEDMELNGAVPHHLIWDKPGELPAGKDRQLEKAVQVLKKEVRKWKKQKPPAIRKASQRL